MTILRKNFTAYSLLWSALFGAQFVLLSGTALAQGNQCGARIVECNPGPCTGLGAVCTSRENCNTRCTEDCTLVNDQPMCGESIRCGDVPDAMCAGEVSCENFCEVAANKCKTCTDRRGISFMCLPCQLPEMPPVEGPEGGGPGGPPPLHQDRCQQGFVRIQGLCITAQDAGPRSFANAQLDCRRIFTTARVATYADFRFIFSIIQEIARFNPNGLWLGDTFTGDNRALFGNEDITSDNDRDVGDFEGEGSRFSLRRFRCAYDLIPAEQVLPLPPAP
jgi:hypothetical protein